MSSCRIVCKENRIYYIRYVSTDYKRSIKFLLRMLLAHQLHPPLPLYNILNRETTAYIVTSVGTNVLEFRRGMLEKADIVALLMWIMILKVVYSCCCIVVDELQWHFSATSPVVTITMVALIATYETTYLVNDAMRLHHYLGDRERQICEVSRITYCLHKSYLIETGQYYTVVMERESPTLDFSNLFWQTFIPTIWIGKIWKLCTTHQLSYLSPKL